MGARPRDRGGDRPASDQVLRQTAPVDSSELADRDAFNRRHPPLTGTAVPEDLRTIAVFDRPWRGNAGRWFDLSHNRVLSAHLAELRPGGRSVRHRHTTEAYIYIVAGRGYSLVSRDDGPIERIEWSEGTLFSPPVWGWHQHFNLDPERPARYLAIQDTGLVRHLGLHDIERHPDQGEATTLSSAEDGPDTPPERSGGR